MAQYYYDKFNTIANHTPSFGHNPGGSNFSVTLSNFNSSTSYTYGYSYNPASSTFTGVSKIVDPISFPGTFYLAGSILIKYELASVSGVVAYYTRYDASGSTVTTSYLKGSLVQASIPAEDGTYPVNGRHADGYWYVKGAAAVYDPGTVSIENLTYVDDGGRKITRLSNGWLVTVSAMMSMGSVLWHVSKDNGVTWSQLSTTNSGGWTNSFALASYGTTVYTVVTSGNGSLGVVKFDATTVPSTGQSVTSTGIGAGQTEAVQSLAIAVDQSNGHVHIAWTSKTGTYPNSANIRYTKSTNAGATWDGAKNLTTLNVINEAWHVGELLLHNGTPIVIASWIKTGANTIYAHVLDTSGTPKSYLVYTATYPVGAASGAVDKDGTLYVVWATQTSAANQTYNIMTSRSLNGGTSWASAHMVTHYTGGKHSIYPKIEVDAVGKPYIVFSTTALIQSDGYSDIASFYSNDKGVNWLQGAMVATSNVNNLTRPHVLYDPTFSVTFKNPPPTLYQHANGSTVRLMFKGTMSVNKAPSISITSPSNNLTLYENDTINLSGDAYDSDKDQSVTVFYQINDEQRKVLATNVSQTQISLSKQLTFKDGKLFDGETALTDTLAEGVAHTLKVWAVDSENGQSTTIERTFYVVPNRAPLLAIDAVVPSGIINTDKFKISGTASDQDANSSVKVNYRINGANPIEIYDGTGGAWEFEVSLGQLKAGENLIIVVVIDNYGAKTSKTIKLNKNEVKTPILQSVARYKIEPPKGSAKGVLLFVERDEELDLKVELSMTLTGEQEQYETLTPESTAPMPYTDSVVEDTFYYEATEPKSNIILKLTTSRSDLLLNHKIHLVSGAVE